MHANAVFFVCLSVYFCLNLVCAGLLHRHAQRQAHLHLRVLDVVVHFAILSVLAIPALAVVVLMAVFGAEEPPYREPAMQGAAARAA